MKQNPQTSPSHKKTKLQNLVDGSPFVIESLDKQFKCLYLVRGGDSTCKVQGYKMTDAGGYSPFADFFSPATEVVHDKSRKYLSINKNGDLSIPKEYIPEKEEVKKEEVKQKKTKAYKISNNMETQNNNEVNAAKRGAGRPKKHTITLPHGEEFTVNQLAQKLGVKKFVINNEISKIKKSNPDTLQVVGTIPQGKGKPAKVFKLI
jgi:hypothetical protein